MSKNWKRKPRKSLDEKLAEVRRQLIPIMVPSKVPVVRERAVIVIQPGSDAERALQVVQGQQQLLDAAHNDLVKQLLAYNRKAKAQQEPTTKLETLKFQQEATAEYTHFLLQLADYQRPGRDDIYIASKADSTLRDDPQWERSLRRHHANNVRREEIQVNKALQKKHEALRLNKEQEGLDEIVSGSLITLQDMETKTEERYYLTADLPGHNRCLSEKTFPAPLEDVEIICLDSELGKALLGRFVNDNIPVYAPGGTFQYQVLASELLDNKYPSCFQSAEKSIHQTIENQSNSSTGNRAINTYARDNGKFGSFPAHDSYGDESDAESNDNSFFDL